MHTIEDLTQDFVDSFTALTTALMEESPAPNKDRIANQILIVFNGYVGLRRSLYFDTTLAEAKVMFNEEYPNAKSHAVFVEWEAGEGGVQVDWDKIEVTPDPPVGEWHILYQDRDGDIETYHTDNEPSEVVSQDFGPYDTILHAYVKWEGAHDWVSYTFTDEEIALRE